MTIFEDSQGPRDGRQIETLSTKQSLRSLCFKCVFVPKLCAIRLKKNYYHLLIEGIRWIFTQWKSHTHWVSSVPYLALYSAVETWECLWAWPSLPFIWPGEVRMLCLCPPVSIHDAVTGGSVAVWDVSVGKNIGKPLFVTDLPPLHRVTPSFRGQCPHILTRASRPFPNGLLSTLPALLNSQLLYFWFAFSVAEWIGWLPFSFSVTDFVCRWLRWVPLPSPLLCCLLLPPDGHSDIDSDIKIAENANWLKLASFPIFL